MLRVRLEIGRLAAVLPDALRFCFDVCARAPWWKALHWKSSRRRAARVCRDCGGEVALVDCVGRCACGGADLRIIAGEELRIKEMEIA